MPHQCSVLECAACVFLPAPSEFCRSSQPTDGSILPVTKKLSININSSDIIHTDRRAAMVWVEKRGRREHVKNKAELDDPGTCCPGKYGRIIQQNGSLVTSDQICLVLTGTKVASCYSRRTKFRQWACLCVWKGALFIRNRQTNLRVFPNYTSTLHVQIRKKSANRNRV